MAFLDVCGVGEEKDRGGVKRTSWVTLSKQSKGQEIVPRAAKHWRGKASSLSMPGTRAGRHTRKERSSEKLVGPGDQDLRAYLRHVRSFFSFGFFHSCSVRS